MIKTILILTALVFYTYADIYDYQITAIDGTTINLSDFRGKKILLVNTATNSAYVDQYGSLEQLYQKYMDSLVIIAIPSNSFGNEPNSDDSIESFVKAHYDIHYLLASKGDVTGDSIAPIFQWLTDSSLNHTYPNPVNEDFDKYLINDQGQIVAAFAGAVDPMDSIIQNAIQTQ